MSTVACPHCGRQNFSISAYCARCERPLGKLSHVTEPHVAEPPSRRSVTTSKPRLSPYWRSAAPPDPPPALSAAQAAEVGNGPILPARPIPPEPQIPERLPIGMPIPPVPAQARPTPLPLTVRKLAPATLPFSDDRPASPSLARTTKPHRSAPPSTTAATPGRDRLAFMAPIWRRAVGWTIDLGVVLAPALLVFWLESRLLFALERSTDADWPTLAMSLVEPTASPWLHTVIAAALMAVTYTFVASRGSGRSLGRWLTGTRLITDQGLRCNAWTAATRALLALVSLGAFGCGFLWCIVDRRHRAWHDIVAGTLVVVTASGETTTRSPLQRQRQEDDPVETMRNA